MTKNLSFYAPCSYWRIAEVVNWLRVATVAECKFDPEVCGGICVNEPCVIDRNMVSGRTCQDSGYFVGPWIKMLESAAV